MLTLGIIFLGVQPYISVPGSVISFELPTFQNCDIGLVSTRFVQSYSMVGLDQPKPLFVAAPSLPITIDIPKTKVLGRNLDDVQVENLYSTNRAIFPEGTRFRVTIDCTPSINCDIKSISIDGKPVQAEKFAKEKLITKNEVVRVRKIREVIAGLLFRFNDSVSNVVLTMLFLVFVILALRVGKMELVAYGYGNRLFEKYVAASTGRKKRNNSDAAKRLEMFEVYEEFSLLWHSRFHFAQVIGPAIGFILTVSSLVQGLFSVKTANDLDAFTQALHIAMISTFLGLLLRIVALEGERVNLKLVERADLALSGGSSPLPGKSTKHK